MKNSAQIQLFPFKDILNFNKVKKHTGQSIFGNLFARLFKRSQGTLIKNNFSAAGQTNADTVKKQNTFSLYIESLKTVFAKNKKLPSQRNQSKINLQVNGGSHQQVIRQKMRTENGSERSPVMSGIKPNQNILTFPSLHKNSLGDENEQPMLLQNILYVGNNRELKPENGLVRQGKNKSTANKMVDSELIPGVSIPGKDTGKIKVQKNIFIPDTQGKRGIHTISQQTNRAVHNENNTIPTQKIGVVPILGSNSVNTGKKASGAQMSVISNFISLESNDEYTKFVKHISDGLKDEKGIKLLKSKKMPDQESLKTYFTVKKILVHKMVLNKIEQPFKMQPAEDIEIIYNKKNEKKPVTIQVKNKRVATQVKNDMHVIQKVNAEKYLSHIKFEIRPKSEVRITQPEPGNNSQNPEQLKKSENQFSQLMKTGVKISVNQEAGQMGKAQNPAMPPLVQKKNKYKQTKTAPQIQDTKNKAPNTLQTPVLKNTAPGKITGNPSIPAEGTEVKQEVTTKGNGEKGTVNNKTDSLHQNVLKENTQPLNDLVQAPRSKFDGLAGKLHEIIQKYDWTKKRLGIKTNFRIESGPVGKMEIQFKEKGQTRNVQIFVESESAKSEVQKVLPQIQHSLSEKGMLLENITVNVSNFATTPEQFRESQKQKTKQSVTATNRKEAADEQNESTLTQRKFGYNTIEIIA